jgi:hypothetical protein
VNEENRVAIASGGAILPLITLLASPSVRLQEWAAGTLWNLSADEKNRAMLMSAGAIPRRTALLGSPAAGVRSVAEGALHHLTVRH